MQPHNQVVGYGVTLKDFTFCPPRHVKSPVLSKICLHVNPGEFVGVLGDNGCGKSSLIKAIAGEHNSNHQKGEVWIESTPVTRQARDLIDGVGIVHQNKGELIDLNSEMTIASNIYVRKLRREWSASNMRYLDGNDGLLKSFRTGLAIHAKGLKAPVESLVSDLSGGERQLLNAVIAIHFENTENPCRLLLLDEHTSDLSTANANELQQYVLAEIQRIRCTVIMVTHQRIQDVINHCTRALILKDGRIAHDLDGAALKKHTKETIESLWTANAGSSAAGTGANL